MLCDCGKQLIKSKIITAIEAEYENKTVKLNRKMRVRECEKCGVGEWKGIRFEPA